MAENLGLGALSGFLASVTAEKGGYASVADDLGRLSTETGQGGTRISLSVPA